MKEHLLERTLWLKRPLPELFAFFSDAHNLEDLTPPWMHFRVLTPTPIDMRLGLRIDYQLRVRGLPLRWQSEITMWKPPGSEAEHVARFVDEQRRGPYRLWIHEHRFETRDGGTLVSDRVRYSVPGGRIVNALFVSPDLRRIFDYRTQRLLELFPATLAGPHTNDS